VPRRKSHYRAQLRGLTSLLKSPEDPVVVPEGMPATVEVGMGAGHVLVGRARTEPERFFVGLEIKEERAYQAAREIVALGLRNVVLVVGEVSRMDAALPSQRFEEMLLLFPDPWPKKRDVARRLFAPRYLQIFARWMLPKARGILRSDNPAVIELALASLADYGCVVTSTSADVPPEALQTRYESRFRSEAQPIGEIRFRWPASVAERSAALLSR
jgi:tRNA (guanine-N7-)-methyltransferase